MCCCTNCGWLCVHAGVLPSWSADQVLALAAEVEVLLRGPDLAAFLPLMYGNEPACWSDELRGEPRWRCVINALTRLRFCSADGEMEFRTKDGAASVPPGFMPWFDVPGRRTAGQPMACGHWSTLGLVDRPELLAIDTGCVWGGALTTVRVDELTRAGVLMSYGWKIEDEVRRLPYFLDRILKGTPPGDMAVEQASRFYLVINLMTARAIGLTMPLSLLLQATEVIE